VACPAVGEDLVAVLAEIVQGKDRACLTEKAGRNRQALHAMIERSIAGPAAGLVGEEVGGGVLAAETDVSRGAGIARVDVLAADEALSSLDKESGILAADARSIVKAS
jgi:hypothetical protein